MLGILLNFVIGCIDSLVYSEVVNFIVALDLFCVDSIDFDAFFKLVSPLFGTRHILISRIVKLRELS